MHDIQFIRTHPDQFDAALARRKLAPQAKDILAIDHQRRAVQTELQKLQAERNAKSQEIGAVKKSGGDAQALMDSVSALKARMEMLEIEDRQFADSLTAHLASLPNILADDVADGMDEGGNVEVIDRRYREPKTEFIRQHPDIGKVLGMMDFETAAKISGSRFVMLTGALARLERALAQFMLDTHTAEHGFTEVSPPLLVNDKTMFGTGQLPKFADDQFKTTRGDWLIPTSEVPLTNIVAEMIVEEEYLPRRYTAFTPCFRQEAGAAGKDTIGMLRQHQFYKVELVSITTAEKSEEEHIRMLDCAETILKKLELPFRTMLLCSGDTGFGARKTYDIEVWLPGQQKYREISSVSNCGDFQARRMNARCRPKGEKSTRFVHTLNGSGVAVGRALIAVMENYYDPADGGIFVPNVLKKYMGNIEKVTLLKEIS
jgi:seryl-tRNA synthetase